MSWFGRLFRRSGRGPAKGKRYPYPTGNVELAMRVERGELLMAVLAEVKNQWTPGFEHLWDEYDPESLLDTPEKRRHAVNYLLFGRITVSRALRARGQDVRGQDPFKFRERVPDVASELEVRFPHIFGPKGSVMPLQLVPHVLKLSPGDPGIPPDPPAGTA